jgi:excisionase family DNA binding protein
MYRAAGREDDENRRMELLLCRPSRAARRLGMSRRQVWREMRAGKLGYVTIGRCRRIPADWLADYAERWSG